MVVCCWPEAEQHGIADTYFGEGSEEIGDCLVGAPCPFADTANDAGQVFERLAQDGIDEGLAVRVAAVHGGARHLCQIRDPLHAHAGVLREQPGRRAEDALLVPASVGPRHAVRLPAAHWLLLPHHAGLN